jgi:dTDP-4-amino-4,6-dideoxygalactose transaminase
MEAGWQVPLADIAVDDELLEASRAAVASGWWSLGPRVAEFERAFSEMSATKHAFAVSSGTAALHLALLAIGCGPGDEVILPSLNFVAAANTIVHTGAAPVFCDIRGEGDLNLDPTDLEAAVGPKTKAILALHYGGFPCDMDSVTSIAERHRLAVVEDAAHAPGASWRGRPCGSLGAAGCFSFFSNKNLPVGEGGMLVTNDDQIAERVRLLRSHGMTTLTWDRHRGHASGYDVVLPGFNYRLDELRAAIALVQLDRLETGNAARARIVAGYREAFAQVEEIELAFPSPIPVASSSHHLAVALLAPGVDRDAARAALHEQRIQTSLHYPPIHRFSAFAGQGAERPLPRTEDAANRLVTLPLFPHMTDEQLGSVATALTAAVASRVRA